MRRAALLLTLLIAPFARSQDPEPAEAKKDPEQELQEQAKELREAFAEMRKAAEQIPLLEKRLPKEQLARIVAARGRMFEENASGRTWAPMMVAVSRHLAEAHTAQVAVDKLSVLAEMLDLTSRLMLRSALLIDPKAAAGMPKSAKQADAQVRKAIAEARKLWETKDKGIIEQFPALEEELEEDPRYSHLTEVFATCEGPLRLLEKIARKGREDTAGRDASIKAAVALFLHWVEFGVALGDYAEELSKQSD